MEEVRTKVHQAEPAVDIELLQLLQDMIGDLSNAPEPVQIKLFSNDPTLLKEWGPRVGEAIEKIPGIVDVLNGIDNTISGPAIASGESGDRRTSGLHTGRSRDRCRRDAWGRTCAHTGNQQRSRLQHPHQVSRTEPRLARSHEQYADQ